MPPKTIYLTIDDFPSVHGVEKVKLLLDYQIPAILYARGSCLREYLDIAIFAIKKGFLIGNHSYNHPSFSQLALAECQDEIDKTELLIDQAYNLAKVARPLKTIRFPFGDLGPQGLEDYLKVNTFQKAILPAYLKNNSYSVPWTLDVLDYKTKLTQQPNLFLEKLETSFLNSPYSEEIVLAHDFDHNQAVFEGMIDYFLQRKIIFKELKYLRK